MEKMLKGGMPKIEATMLVYSQEGGEMQFPMANNELQLGDLVLLEQGKIVPADTKILSGTISADNQGKIMVFGPKSIALGGLLILEGMAKGYVFAKAEESQLAL